MGNVKDRIKNIIKDRKTVTAAAVCAAAVCILAAVVFMPREEPGSGSESTAAEGARAGESTAAEGARVGESTAADDTQMSKSAVKRSAKVLKRAVRYGKELSPSAAPAPVYFEDHDDLAFADLEGIEFWFGSGAGAWCTTVTIQPDGTFEGCYHDSDIGGSYMAPLGMRYECRFHGRFTALRKTAPYEYSMKCESLEIEGTVGEENEVDGYVVVTTDPYGFDDADEFALYLPGKSINELPEGYRPGASAADGAMSGILERYGMYNIGGDQSYEVWPEFDLSQYISEPESSLSPAPTLSPEKIERIRAEYGYEDKEDFQFSDLQGQGFWSHRQGGESNVEIEADGSFHGIFHEGSYMPAGEGYPNGVRYECHYSGRFSQAVKTGPYEYTLKCEYIEVEGTVGAETLVDGVKVITSEPHGFDSADEFKLFLPGKRKLEMPEEYFEWYNYWNDPRDGVSDGYILYNVGGNEFFGVPKG